MNAPDPVPAADTGDGIQDELWEQPFPGYEVTEKIAQGGMGAVFLANDLRLSRRVAIKALIPDLASHEDAVEQFFNEARNVARLRHPNVVRGLDVGRAGKYFYFVMEYVRGETLAQKLERLERGRIPEAQALAVIRDVARGLQCVFEHGLVHRDIKPANIILSEDGPARLCDLGVAREVAFPRAEDVVKGSPSYASPEQVRGDLDVDIRADLYGLGCTWFHCLTGHPPYRGVSPEEIMRQHLEAETPNPREEDVRISAATGELVRWLLQKDRDDRPRTPQVFLGRLAEHPLLAGDKMADAGATAEKDSASGTDMDDDSLDAEDDGEE